MVAFYCVGDPRIGATNGNTFGLWKQFPKAVITIFFG